MTMNTKSITGNDINMIEDNVNFFPELEIITLNIAESDDLVHKRLFKILDAKSSLKELNLSMIYPFRVKTTKEKILDFIPRFKGKTNSLPFGLTLNLCSKIKSLDLAFNSRPKQKLTKFKKLFLFLNNLEKLKFGNSPRLSPMVQALDSQDITELLLGTESMLNLQEFALIVSNITQVDAIANQLRSFFEQHPRLRAFGMTLKNTQLRKTDIFSIVGALKYNKSLESFSLFSDKQCEHDDKDVESIQTLVSRNLKLTKFSILTRTSLWK